MKTMKNETKLLKKEKLHDKYDEKNIHEINIRNKTPNGKHKKTHWKQMKANGNKREQWKL